MMVYTVPKVAESPGGTQIWFGRGRAAQALKPITISKGYVCQKWYPIVGISLKI